MAQSYEALNVQLIEARKAAAMWRREVNILTYPPAKDMARLSADMWEEQVLVLAAELGADTPSDWQQIISERGREM